MALRLTDIRHLEKDKSGCHSTIRDLTSQVDALEQQLAEIKDEVQQVLLPGPRLQPADMHSVTCSASSPSTYPPARMSLNPHRVALIS